MCMVKWKSVMGGGSNVGWISTKYSKLHVLTGFPLSIVESPLELGIPTGHSGFPLNTMDFPWHCGFPLAIVDSR